MSILIAHKHSGLKNVCLFLFIRNMQTTVVAASETRRHMIHLVIEHSLTLV